MMQHMLTLLILGWNKLLLQGTYCVYHMKGKKEKKGKREM
jgi:hypothetical protein